MLCRELEQALPGALLSINPIPVVQATDPPAAILRRGMRLPTGDALQGQREGALPEGGVERAVLLKLAARRGWE